APVIGNAALDVGCAGAASFAASLVKCCLALYHEILPPIQSSTARHSRRLDSPQFWLTNAADGPRRAAVVGGSVGGNCVCALLEEFDTDVARIPAEPLLDADNILFALEADTPLALSEELHRLE